MSAAPTISSTSVLDEQHEQPRPSLSRRVTRYSAAAVRDYFVPQDRWGSPEPAGSADADEQPAPDPEAARAAEQARLEHALRIDRLLKARRLPHAVTGVVGGIGTGGWGVALAIADAGGNPLVAMPLAAATTLAATGGVVWIGRKVISDTWRRRVWMVGTVAAIWVALQATAHAPGVTFVLLGTLLVLEYLVARGWRSHHPLPIGATAEQVAEAVATPVAEEWIQPDAEHEVVDADIAALIDSWAANVAAQGGAVPGSVLTDGETSEFAVSFTLQLVRGRQNIKKVKATADDIASGLGVEPEDLLIEKFPHADGEKKDSSKLKFTVVLKSPVDTPRFFTGPNLALAADGRSCSASVGRYADGAGEAFWKFWNSGGMRNGVLIGGTRSGKGGVTAVLGASARATGMLNTLYIDPQEGMSSPGLAQHATVSILGRQAAAQSIQVVEALAQNREHVGGVNTKARRRKDMFTDAVPKLMPSQQRPGWLVIIDECDKIFSNQAQAKAWSEFVSRCLKLGMSVVAITQYPGLTAFGLESLRSNLAQNYIALKTYSQSSGDLIPGLTKDPNTLPDEKPGFGLFGGGERSDVPLRADWLPEDEEKLSDEPPLRLGQALEQHPEPAVCDMDRRALVGILGDPDEDGMWTLSGDTVLDEQPASVQTPADGGGGGGPDFAAVSVLPTVPTPLTVVPMPEITEAQAKVLGQIGDRPVRTADVIARTGLSRRHASRTLQELAAYGFIHQPGGTAGWWQAGNTHAETIPAEQETG